MYFSFVRQGIKPEDIKFLYYSDAGMDIYGNGIVVSKKMLDANPAVVKAFVAATAKGWRDAIANPAAAIAALKEQSALTDEKLETEKLNWLIKNQITTAESRTDGMGGIRTARMSKAIDTLTGAFGLPAKPKVDDVFTSAFLPAADIRKLP
jgi:NitT/TauT family transport system substrate-binding protein